jgi:hypothetical protein
MELTLEEQQLIADFRRLDVESRRALVAQARQLRRSVDEQEAEPTQCSLKKTETRPETSREPIFTE